MNEQTCLELIVKYIRGKTTLVPELAVILGSGWGECLDRIVAKTVLTFDELPFFPKSTIPEHAGKMIFGELHDIPIVVLQGRVHYYEGYEMYEVVRPVRVFKMLGAKTIVLTNAAGAINANYQIGDIVSITNHISSFVPNPLRGVNLDMLGPRFPDMSEIYDVNLRNIAKTVGERTNIEIKSGIYVQTAGPSFESAAEIQLYGRCGANLVGMSTVCEAIAAVHAGIKVAALSFVSNLACGLTTQKQSMEDVVMNSNLQKKKCSNFFIEYLKAIMEV